MFIHQVIEKLTKIYEYDPQGFFFIHFNAIIHAILSEFLLQFVTNCPLKMYQSHKKLIENEKSIDCFYL